MPYLVEVGYKKHLLDALGESLKKDVLDLGIKNISEVFTVQLYSIETELLFSEIEEICQKLLCDPIAQFYQLNQKIISENNDAFIVEVWFKKGVTDAVGDTVIKGANDLGYKGKISNIKTGYKYILQGKKLTKVEVEQIAQRLLANEIIQEYFLK